MSVAASDPLKFLIISRRKYRWNGMPQLDCTLESVHGSIVGLMLAVDLDRIKVPNSYIRMVHDAFSSFWTLGLRLSILNVKRQNGQLVALRIAARLRVLFASLSVPQAKNNF